MSNHSENWFLWRNPDGSFYIYVKGKFDMPTINIIRIEEAYDCCLVEIFTDRLPGERKDSTVFSFNRHDVEYRTLLLQCGHTMDFDTTYEIEPTEYCEHCDKMVKVAADGEQVSKYFLPL
ncbi:MAG: hypothetical protein WBQ25_03920 [Nitrososphaeraceae archaeon]